MESLPPTPPSDSELPRLTGAEKQDESTHAGDDGSPPPVTLEDAPEPSAAAAPREADRAAPHATSLRSWLSGAPLPPRLHLLLGLIAPAIVLAANFWCVASFTIDDAYISFRYARNLANGLGLVYNPGERIEGYTNFLWTVILAGGIKLGLDPDVFAKVLGALSAFAALGLTYALAARLRPLTLAPCVATWLLASTIVFSGYAVFGLETPFFLAMLLLGTWLLLREEPVLEGASERWTESARSRPPGSPYRAAPAADTSSLAGGFPLSAIPFALAGLTRPEAPMFLGILMLFLGRGFFSRKNLLRGGIFSAALLGHALFRHAYYGTWLPNTLSAKTGDLSGQLVSGARYVGSYADHAGPVLWIALFAIAVGLVERRRALLAIATIAAAVLGYVVLVGGDWMPFFRFVAPFEPFAFLLVDVAARRIVERKERAATIALALFAAVVAFQRTTSLRDAQASILAKEKHFWDTAAGGTARWFVEHGQPGSIALGDIGYVGYVTDYPILDMLGLVDPVISKLPGAYTRKLGPAFNDHFFEVMPRYFLLISSNVDCQHPSVPNSTAIYKDARFRPSYQVAGKVPLDGGFAWCIYETKATAKAAEKSPAD